MVAAYSDMLGTAWNADNDETLRMRPEPRATMSVTKSRVSAASVAAFSSTMRATASASIAVNAPPYATPALFTSTSTVRLRLFTS